MAVDLLGDQGEVPLRVGLAPDELTVGAELGVQPRDLAETAVVSHDAPPHRERLRIRGAPAAYRSPAHMRDEDRRGGLLRLADELGSGEGGLGLLIEDGLTSGIKEADPAAIDIAPALYLE